MTGTGRLVRILAGICIIAGLLVFNISTAGADQATPPTDTAASSVQSTPDTQSSGNQTAVSEVATTPDSGNTTTNTTDNGTTNGTNTDGSTNGTGGSADPTAVPTDTTTTEPTADTSTTIDSTAPAGATPGAENASSTSNATTPNDVTASPEATAPPDVTISVHASLCAADSSTSDCTPAEGVKFTATVAGGSNPQDLTTGADGSATATVPQGSNVDVELDASTTPSGYTLTGNSTQSLSNAQDGDAVTFLFATTGTGRVQVTNITCPTSGQSRTEWQVIEPSTQVARAAAVQRCEPKSGPFTITGASTVNLTTDGSGSWKGFLAPGDYTITEASSGSTHDFSVAADGIAVVVAVDYVAQPNGTLSLTNYDCPSDHEGTDIFVGSNPAGANCQPADGQFQIDGANPFSVGSDGAINMPIPAGSYTLEDVASGQSAPFTITEGQTTRITVIHYVTTGTVSVTSLSCPNPVPQGVDSSDPTYWQANCTGANSGDALALIDGNGNTVATTNAGSDGSAVFDQVQPGVYTLNSDTHCAIFVGSSDASGGFRVSAGATTSVTAYACTWASSNNNNGGGTTDNGGDGTQGVGGDQGGATNSYAAVTTDTTGTANVTQLPNTGAGGERSPQPAPWEAGLLVLLAAGGVALGARRWKRAA